MFHHILVPLDGSDYSECAVDYAADVARKYGASIHLIRVRSYPVMPYAMVEVPTALPPTDAEKQVCEDYLQKVQQRELGVPVTFSSPIGSPAETILEEAVERGADLIVLTSHGRTGFNRFLVGSTAERIARHSHCPVLMLGKETLVKHIKPSVAVSATH